MTVNRNACYINPLLELVDPVIDSLLQVEDEDLKQKIQELIDENSLLGGHYKGFYYSGDVFSPYAKKLLRGSRIKEIDPTLEERAEYCRARRNRLAEDRKKLQQLLTIIFSKCKTKQDVRDVLPEVIANKVDAFKGMPRQNNEGFILADNPMLMNQYCAAVDQALEYLVEKLIY